MLSQGNETSGSSGQFSARARRAKDAARRAPTSAPGLGGELLTWEAALSTLPVPSRPAAPAPPDVSRARPVAKHAHDDTLASAEVLTGIARALDQLGVLCLHLAETADQPEADPMLTIEEAAAELRYSPSHIRAKCTSGELEALNDGGWRIRRSALKRYEKRRTGR